MENYAEIFGNIMQKKVTIMRKFLKLIKLFPWLFPMYEMYMLTSYQQFVLSDMFDILLPFMDRYFFVQRSFP